MKKKIKSLFGVLLSVLCIMVAVSFLASNIFKKSNTPFADAIDLPTQGGGMYVGDGGSLTLDGGTITGYAVNGEGGGVWLGKNSKLTMNYACIDQNISYRAGAGIYASPGAEIIVNGNSFFKYNESTYVGGGAIYLDDGSTLTINGDANIGGNKALKGGGVYVYDNSTFTMNDGHITQNTATTGGGGVYIESVATFIMNGGYIGDNICTDDEKKADIWCEYDDSAIYLNGGTINGNIFSEANIHMKSASYFQMSGTITLGDYANITMVEWDETAPTYKVDASNSYGIIMRFQTGNALSNSSLSLLIDEWARSNLTIENDKEYYFNASSTYLEVGVRYKNVKVSFNANGGSCSISSKTVQYKSKFGALPSASRSGYTFNGWWTTASGGTRITADTVSSYLSNITLYAHWTPIVYTLSLYPNNGGTVTTAYWKYNTGLYSDSACTTYITKVTIPTRSGYNLKGYYYNSMQCLTSTGSANTSYLNTCCVNYASTDNVLSLTAQWDGIVYEFDFSNEGGTGGPSYTKIYIKYGSGVYSNSACTSKLTSLSKPSLTGYTFSSFSANYYYLYNNTSRLCNYAITNSSGSILSSSYSYIYPAAPSGSSRKISAKYTLNSGVKVINETKSLTYTGTSAFRNAVSAAASGNIIRVVDDITDTSTTAITVGAITVLGSRFKNVTMKLSGKIDASRSKFGQASSPYTLTISFQKYYAGTVTYAVRAQYCYFYSGVNITSGVTVAKNVGLIWANGCYIYGGNFSASTGRAIYNTSSSQLCIYGGYINGGIYVEEEGQLYIAGGSIIKNNGAAIEFGTFLSEYADSYDLEIVGGTITGSTYSIYTIHEKTYVTINQKNLNYRISIAVPAIYNTASKTYVSIGSNTTFGSSGYIRVVDTSSEYDNIYDPGYVFKYSTGTAYDSTLVSHLEVYDKDGVDIINSGYGWSFYFDSTNHVYYVMTCFDIDSDILVWDDKKKRVVKKKAKNIKYTDKLLVWNFDKGCLDFAEPLFIQRHITVPSYDEIKFSDGTIWKVAGEHSVFSLDHNDFRAIVSSNPEYGCPIGTRVINADGKVLTIVAKRHIEKPLTHTNIFTNYHMNIYINGILSSTPMNNIYEIKDMKFVKRGEHCETKELLAGIDEKYIKGMRLEEYTDEKIKFILKVNPTCETLKDFIDNKASYNK